MAGTRQGKENPLTHESEFCPAIPYTLKERTRFQVNPSD